METLITWMVAIMLTIAPHHPSFIPGAEETEEEMKVRYKSIAEDIVEVTYDQYEVPIYSGPKGRLQSTTTVLAIAFFESGFRKHVDYNLGKYGRGDKGNSWCIMQLNIGKGKTVDGWTGEEIIADRTKCIRSAYQYIKKSFGACRSLPQIDGLSAYASGKCYSPSTPSRRRLNLAANLFQKAPDINDDKIIRKLYIE